MNSIRMKFDSTADAVKAEENIWQENMPLVPGETPREVAGADREPHVQKKSRSVRPARAIAAGRFGTTMLAMDNSELVSLTPAPMSRELYLIGFRLDPESEGPQFYTIIGSEGESERPITRKERILFFRQPADAQRALAISDNGLSDIHPAPSELELLCDVSHALYVANQQDEDTDGVLFEMIAVFDDLLRATKLTVPMEYASMLAAVAERLESSQELASFLKQNEIKREKLEDALLWCVGAIAVKSTWVG